MPQQPSAKIIADSINDWGQRLTTMEVVMHRFVLAEFNTHRVFSRNSASSRAIPSIKIQDRVQNDPALPVYWGTEISGMQSGVPITDDLLKEVKQEWMYIRAIALDSARRLTDMDLHKSLVNRLLEPFMWHTVIVTATDWDNFFWQRCHPDAQPEMRAAADEMQRAFFRSAPRHLTHGMWHLPYIKREDIDWAENRNATLPAGSETYSPDEALRRVSVARCARVSYLTQSGVRDPQEDLNLFDRLKESGHWSPFEHIATPVALGSQYPTSNFRGWRQFRKEFRQENRMNFVPNLPDLADVVMRMEAGLNSWKGESDDN